MHSKNYKHVILTQCTNNISTRPYLVRLIFITVIWVEPSLVPLPLVAHKILLLLLYCQTSTSITMNWIAVNRMSLQTKLWMWTTLVCCKWPNAFLINKESKQSIKRQMISFINANENASWILDIPWIYPTLFFWGNAPPPHYLMETYSIFCC